MPVRGGATIERPLSFANGREQIDDPSGNRLLPGLELQPAFGIDGRELIEIFDVGVVFRLHAVDVENFLEPRPLLAATVLHHTVDEHAFAEAKFFDHCAGHERIGSLPRQVIRQRTQEPVAVRMEFQDAAAGLWRGCISALGNFDIGHCGARALIVMEAAIAPHSPVHAATRTATVPTMTAVRSTTATPASAPTATITLLSHTSPE